MLDPHQFLDDGVGIGLEYAFNMADLDVIGEGIEAADFGGDDQKFAGRA